MTSPRFDAMLQAGSADDRLQAMREILAVQKARLVLGNAVLQDIASKLKENEPALLEGRENLGEALDRLENVARVLNTISGFLEVIGKVVPLVDVASADEKLDALEARIAKLEKWKTLDPARRLARRCSESGSHSSLAWREILLRGLPTGDDRLQEDRGLTIVATPSQ
jgi:hypothetical protein